MVGVDVLPVVGAGVLPVDGVGVLPLVGVGGFLVVLVGLAQDNLVVTSSGRNKVHQGRLGLVVDSTRPGKLIP